MKGVLRRLGWGVLIASVLVALALAAFVLWGLPELLPAGSAIVIDGERFEIGELRPTHAGHWLLGSIGVLIAALVIVIVVPLIIVLSVAVPLVMGAFGFAVGLLALGLAISPVVLLVWWLWKKPAAGARTAPSSPHQP